MERASASMHWQGPHSKRGALAQTPPRPSPPRFNERREPAANKLRATSHTSEEPWPWNCESPKQKCPKAVSTHLQTHVVWSRILMCSVKSYMTWALDQMLFQRILFMQGLTHNKKKLNKPTLVSIRSAEIFWCCVRPISKRWFFEDSPGDHETWSIWCHAGIHVDFTSILHSLVYSVGPSNIVWSELGPAPPFPLMRVLEVEWSQALSLVCAVAVSYRYAGWGWEITSWSSRLQENHPSF